MNAPPAPRPVDPAEFARLAAGASPTVFAFVATWNARCQAFAPRLGEFAGRHAGRVEVVCVDVDESMPLVRELVVCSVPTLLAMRAGSLLHREESVELDRLEALLAPA
jgi:thioredoxin-like negative regulator of GroEL